MSKILKPNSEYVLYSKGYEKPEYNNVGYLMRKNCANNLEDLRAFLTETHNCKTNLIKYQRSCQFMLPQVSLRKARSFTKKWQNASNQQTEDNQRAIYSNNWQFKCKNWKSKKIIFRLKKISVNFTIWVYCIFFIHQPSKNILY